MIEPMIESNFPKAVRFVAFDLNNLPRGLLITSARGISGY